MGMSKPRIEKQNAPINPMNGPIVGTATASSTDAVTRIVLKLFQDYQLAHMKLMFYFVPHCIVDQRRPLLEFVLHTDPCNI